MGVARHCGEAEQVLANLRADLVLLDVDFHGEKADLLAALRIQQEFHTPTTVVADKPGASGPSKAVNASEKSPVEIPFRYSHGINSSMLFVRRRYGGE